MAKKPKNKDPHELKTVTIRLFAVDVEQLMREAEDNDLSWQLYTRLRVRRMLRGGKKIVI